MLFCTYSLLTGGSVATSKLKASLPRFERSMSAVEVETVKGVAEFGDCLACCLARSKRADSLQVLRFNCHARNWSCYQQCALAQCKVAKERVSVQVLSRGCSR